MPAAVIVLEAIIEPYVASFVGAELLGSTILASAATGAITGAVGSAAYAAATGGDVGKAALRGAEAGGIGGGVSNVVGRAVGTGTAGSRAVSSGAGQAAATLATGGSGKQALESGLMGGVSSYLASQIPRVGSGKAGDVATRIERGLAQQGISSQLNQLLGSKQQTSGGGQYQAPQTAISGQGTQPQSQPGTAALAQALRVGDAGGPIFGASGEDKGKKPSGWNIESLRYMGSEA